ncbi:hypothetical protein TIFTF001_009920 [Ficus carica]|uniref:Uncharacterized protein n=1 Tax=Ficus carica TaxID=3494 RepID=A0AA88A7R1_FICCA|nr:hypothetical protein TIFTF001_009920 [Ficus carica]
MNCGKGGTPASTVVQGTELRRWHSGWTSGDDGGRADLVFVAWKM